NYYSTYINIYHSLYFLPCNQRKYKSITVRYQDSYHPLHLIVLLIQLYQKRLIHHIVAFRFPTPLYKHYFPFKVTTREILRMTILSVVKLIIFISTWPFHYDFV